MKLNDRWMGRMQRVDRLCRIRRIKGGPDAAGSGHTALSNFSRLRVRVQSDFAAKKCMDW